MKTTELTAAKRTPVSGRRPARRRERGQALVIIAMAMVGLLAFIGLTVDAGILFIGVGHLRRAVDAAALAASSQFREGRTLEQQMAAAREVIHLNGVDPSDLILRICADDPDAEWHMQELCPAEGQPRRKLIYVQAKTMVRFAFLTIIGFHDTEIVADATSEAASVDVVLVIDTSDSMADDGDTSRVVGTGVMNCNSTDPGGADGFPGDCHPFQEVKQAAFQFVEGMFFPYDRVAIVTYDNAATSHLSLTDADSTNKAAVQAIIRNLEVSPWRGQLPECTLFTDGDPSGCTNTSIGGGLLAAGNEFGLSPRQEAVWVVILLTDGAANASVTGKNASDVDVPNAYCPPSTWEQPFCRDLEPWRRSLIDPAVWGNTEPYGHPEYRFISEDPITAEYDANDFARDMADFVSCAAELGDAAEWCRNSLNYIDGKGGQGALMYAIGLGQGVIQREVFTLDADGNEVSGWEYSDGDALLRYIANVGIDGDPNPNAPDKPVDPCQGVPLPEIPLDPNRNASYNCGNYYYAQFGTGLTAVFESIAARVFTRLTK